MQTKSRAHPAIYRGDGDHLMQEFQESERIILVPDALPGKTPDRTPRLRIMWGQHLLDDLVAGRYRTLICAVNSNDNSHGIIAQLAKFLPTSQWDVNSITAYAKSFDLTEKVKVLKYDMDSVEVLAVLRPARQPNLTLPDLAAAMRLAVELLRNCSCCRQPSASVSFLEARANVLVDDTGASPSFETVLKTMHEAGFTGDVYPSPGMWHTNTTGVFARYPFASSLESRRAGGF